MRNTWIYILLFAAMPATAWQQGFDQRFDLKFLNKFAARASDTVDVTLDGQVLQLAGKFLSGNNPDEAKMKKLVNGLKGIYVKSFEFEKEGQYSDSDLAGIRAQLRSPGWSRIVGVKSKKEGENSEIYLQTNGKSAGGLTIISTGPKELTVVQILGSINLDDLSELSGNLGVPQLHLEKDGKPPKK
ncbi:MAG: DUF4252 domain-containing protein [Acidobacteriota bacterium]|nr:DUF4252 domain-containing protein [Acidobacteriota bacterium]